MAVPEVQPSHFGASRAPINGVQAPDAGKHQIFVKWSFQSSRIGNAKNGVGLLDVVCNAQAAALLDGACESPL